MNQEEKDILRSIAQALEMLPSDKKERAVGYAEGVADMKEEMERRVDEARRIMELEEAGKIGLQKLSAEMA